MSAIIIRVLLALSMESYLRGVIPSEVPAMWHMEALCAQAIAARTYGYYKIQYPNGEEFDLWGDARSQVYNAAKLHERTDRAVSETAGLVMTRNGQVFMSEYVVKCGRSDCPLCLGSNGFNGKMWEGRMCQHGANYLAERGWSAIRILRLYYGDSIQLVTVSEKEDDE